MIEFVGFSRQGGRNSNQDYYYPSSEEVCNYPQRLFLVCDGVGGLQAGQEASKLSAKAIVDHLEAATEWSELAVQSAVLSAQQALEHYTKQYDCGNMGSTLAMLWFSPDYSEFFVAHIGDSRIYTFGESGILQRTQDHSLVAELVALGHISEEEARYHPQRNVITRAILPYDEQDSRPILRADISRLEVKGLHSLLLCSDGVLEQWTDQQLTDLLSKHSHLNIKEQIKKLDEQCSQRTKDNYTAILIKLN